MQYLLPHKFPLCAFLHRRLLSRHLRRHLLAQDLLTQDLTPVGFLLHSRVLAQRLLPQFLLNCLLRATRRLGMLRNRFGLQDRIGNFYRFNCQGLWFGRLLDGRRDRSSGRDLIRRKRLCRRWQWRTEGVLSECRFLLHTARLTRRKLVQRLGCGNRRFRSNSFGKCLGRRCNGTRLGCNRHAQGNLSRLRQGIAEQVARQT